MDYNLGGSISILEFKLEFFDDQEEYKKTAADYVLTPQLEKEIEELFNEVDTDKSKYLEPKEIKECLSKMGMILSEIELANYVDRFDTDGDGRISFNEFKIIMAEKL